MVGIVINCPRFVTPRDWSHLNVLSCLAAPQQPWVPAARLGLFGHRFHSLDQYDADVAWYHGGLEIHLRTQTRTQNSEHLLSFIIFIQNIPNTGMRPLFEIFVNVMWEMWDQRDGFARLSTSKVPRERQWPTRRWCVSFRPPGPTMVNNDSLGVRFVDWLSTCLSNCRVSLLRSK